MRTEQDGRPTANAREGLGGRNAGERLARVRPARGSISDERWRPASPVHESADIVHVFCQGRG